MNVKSKLGEVQRNLRKQWLWTGLGATIVLLILNWYLFYIRILPLEQTIFLTIFFPSLLALAYLISIAKNQQNLIGKIIYICLFGVVIGAFIMLVSNSFLVWQSWAPLHNASESWKNSLFFILIIPSFAIGGYIGYLLGRRRNWMVAIMQTN